MAEKRKLKKRKEEHIPGTVQEPEKPSKEEYAIAKWLRSNIPNKKTKFMDYTVEYFTGAKAVDGLMESSWAKIGKNGEEPMFASRKEVVDFLDVMLLHKFFHRAKKIVVSEQELKGKLKKKEKKKEETDEKVVKRKGKKNTEDAESSHAEGCKDEKSLEEKEQRKKRKIRLDMHMEQTFVDGLDAYVWIYDPIPLYYWIFGTLVVLGSIGICVFPLWPPSVRTGVRYLSFGAAGVLVFILALAVFRLFVFCVIWALTLGRHHFWLLPNLVEDVGFFASFWPLYHYEYRGGNTTDDKKSKKKKEKDSDDDEDEDVDMDVDMDAEEGEKHSSDMDLKEPSSGKTADDPSGENVSVRRNSDQVTKDTESESESSQKSTTGSEFDMIEKEDADEPIS